MRKKFLITGISGFAGPNLAKLLLAEGHEVHGVIRCPNGRQTDLLDILTIEEYNQIVFHTVDLKEYHGVNKLFLNHKFDGVFHLAAQSHPPTSFTDPILTFSENVTASLNIITCLQKTETVLMFCSTSEVYGDSCKDKGILKVTDNLTPSNPYASSKAAIDLYMQERMKNGFIKGFVTRAFSHTGPRRGFNFSISSDAYQIAKMKLGLQEKVLRIGNLQTERVVIDVRDCVNAYYLLMMNPNSYGKVYNVCGEQSHKMQYFTDKLIESSGIPYDEIEQRIDEKLYRPIDIQIQIGDSTELKEITGWKPTYTIEKCMEDLLSYWLNKLNNNLKK
jgi:GDP-4-dehydro-6-deoxy-D-mannose reductase